ncbi:Vestigial/Tondu family protein [Trichuris suis]|nr:Vestigial/Tondu family protein [Trichuris suis]
MQVGSSPLLSTRYHGVKDPLSTSTTGFYAEDIQPIPRVQYLSSNCLLLTYTEGDVAGLLEEHFSKSLNGRGGRNYRNFPPSFWNQNYSRCFRNQLVAGNLVPSVSDPSRQQASIATSMGYFHESFPSIIRSPVANSFWSSYSNASVPRTVLPANGGELHAAYASSAPEPHFNPAVATKDSTNAYQHLFGLTKPIGHSAGLQPTQSGLYAGLRGDWYILPDCSRDLSHHINTGESKCCVLLCFHTVIGFVLASGV